MTAILGRAPEEWEATQQRLTQWWAGELYDRALLQVTAPRAGVEPAAWPGGPVSVETPWVDVEHMIWRTLEAIRGTWYGGEALPGLWHNWSIGQALILGCEPRFAPDTVWTDPLPPEADGYPAIRFHRDGRWWRWMRDCTLRAAQASRGRYLVMPMWGNQAGDNLALVRGTDSLMLDVAENPDWVRRAAQEVSDILLEVYAALWPLVDGAVTGIAGSYNYCGLWSPARTMAFDCDVSCMLSPRQFEALFLPPLVETMRSVDHRIYHLDGVVALQHLDLLLSVPEIDAIQWLPGAGRDDSVLPWVPVIRRIQAAGKGALVYAEPREIPALLGAVSARGLCIGTTCASVQEADDLLAAVRRLSRSRPSD